MMIKSALIACSNKSYNNYHHLLMLARQSLLMASSSTTVKFISTSPSSSPPPSFVKGKTVVITGANGNQGRQVALELAKHGASRLILACRNVPSGQFVASEIRRILSVYHRQNPHHETPPPQPQPTIIVSHLDLASLDSVWEFAESIRRTEPSLHLLVNNASTFGTPNRTLTVDDNELTFQTNYLGHYLLTINLLELLSRSAPSRIVNVAASHLSTRFILSPFMGCYRFDDANFQLHPSNYSALRAFAQSKLAMMLFTRALQKRCSQLQSAVHNCCDSNNKINNICNNQSSSSSDVGIKVFAVNPGVIRPDALFQLPFPVQMLVEPLLRGLFKNPGEQAIYCATNTQQIDQLTGGQYIQNNHVCDPGRIATDDVMAENVWKLSRNLTEKRGHFPSTLFAQYYPKFIL